MADGVHHHHHPHSTGIPDPADLRDLLDRDSDVGSRHDHQSQGSGSWPANDGSSASNLSGFNPARTASRAASFSGRTSTHATPPAGPAVRRRTLNGGETAAQLREIVAEMHEEMSDLARQLHDATNGHGNPAGHDPAAHQRAQLRHQQRMQRARADLERERFRLDQEQVDRDRQRLNLNRERGDLQLAQSLQEHEFEQEKARLKMQNMQNKLKTQELEMEVSAAVEAGNAALQLIKRGL